MFFVSNNNWESERLNRSNAAQLTTLNVDFSKDSGWTMAFGRDDSGNLVLVVHGHSMDEFEKMMYPSKYRKKEFRKKLIEQGRTEEEIERIMSKKYGSIPYSDEYGFSF